MQNGTQGGAGNDQLFADWSLDGGHAEFSATNASGQLRFAYDADRDCVVLYGSVDADSEAEFAIELAGLARIRAADLLL